VAHWSVVTSSCLLLSGFAVGIVSRMQLSYFFIVVGRMLSDSVLSFGCSCDSALVLD
jgi:hypothetical protein